MNNFSKINHLSLLTSDLEKGREFYGKILGLEEIERPAYNIQGIWYQLGESQLHLMLLQQGLKTPQCHPEDKTVQPHFALSVNISDYQEIVRKLSILGCEVIEDKLEQLQTEIWQAFFYDYDGNMIEIIAKQERP